MSFAILRGANRDRPVRWSAAWWPLAGFAALLGIRALKVDAMVAAYTRCQDCAVGGLVHHDLAMLALLAALLGLDLLAPWRALRLLLRLAAVVLVALYALDLALFTAFTHRLYLADLATFGGEFGAIGDFLRALLKRPDRLQWFAVAVLVVLICIGIAWRRRRSPVSGVLLLVAAGVAATVWAMPLALTKYVHPEIIANLIEVNQANSANVAYSGAFRQQLAAHPPSAPQRCMRQADSDRPDVILVAVESLSAWHSGLLGGHLDATPELDKLARQNHYFTHFVANGFTTNGGRIALYTGRAPLPPPGLVATLPLRAYAFVDGSLPSLARRAGYTSHYFTSGNLGFLDSEAWLEALGFDSVEGAESPFYQGMKRWQFNAPADKALYDRVLAWMDQRQDPRPFLAALLTVTSHPPFVNPDSGKIDPKGTFRYVDAQLARFYRQLRERGFFDNGVLLITGDHRSMTPLHAYEYRQWGNRAFTRVPMIVIGDVAMPAVIDQTFGQTDMPASFAWLAGLRTCIDPGHGIFTRPQPIAPSYVLFSGGEAIDKVSVYFGKRSSAVRLDGDDSHWLGPLPDHGEAILKRINRQRIREAELARQQSADG